MNDHFLNVSNIFRYIYLSAKLEGVECTLTENKEIYYLCLKLNWKSLKCFYKIELVSTHIIVNRIQDKVDHSYFDITEFTERKIPITSYPFSKLIPRIIELVAATTFALSSLIPKNSNWRGIGETEVVGGEWGEKDKRFLETTCSTAYTRVPSQGGELIISRGLPELEMIPSFSEERIPSMVSEVFYRLRIYYLPEEYSDLLPKTLGKELINIDPKWYNLEDLGIVLGDNIIQGLLKTGIKQIQGKLLTDNPEEWTKILITKIG